MVNHVVKKNRQVNLSISMRSSFLAVVFTLDNSAIEVILNIL